MKYTLPNRGNRCQNQVNHGGIAPTDRPDRDAKPGQPRGDCPYRSSLAMQNRGNHGGIAPTDRPDRDAESGQPRGDCPYRSSLAMQNQGNHGGIAPTDRPAKPGEASPIGIWRNLSNSSG
ncbi:MAG: hypothetical protein VKK80_14310 [Prochlorothrix sp.]|nr:hypothetical protein [Prochlorothrix sp.]